MNPQAPQAVEWRHGWPTLAWCTGALATGAGLLTYTASYFVKPIQAATGWSRGDIAFGTTLGQISLAFTMPVVGILVDRFGTRRVGPIGMLGYGLVCLLLACLPAKLGFYYAALVGIAILAAGTNVIVFAPLVAERFSRRRGIALAIMMSGPALLLTPFAPLMVRLINDVSWRAGYVMLGMGALVVGLPCAIMAVRKSAAAAEAHRVRDPKGAEARHIGLTLPQALRTATYWKMLGAVIASTLPLGGFLHQMSALLSDKGLSVAAVGGLASLFVVAVFLGRTISGFLLDILYPPLVVLAVMLGAATGALLLLTAQPSLPMCAIAVALIGAAMGGEGDIQGFLVARQFGLKAFAAIFGTFGSCTVGGFGIGALIFGRMFDSHGDYQTALVCAAAGFALSGILFALVPARPAAFAPSADADSTPLPAA